MFNETYSRRLKHAVQAILTSTCIFCIFLNWENFMNKLILAAVMFFMQSNVYAQNAVPVVQDLNQIKSTNSNLHQELAKTLMTKAVYVKQEGSDKVIKVSEDKNSNVHFEVCENKDESCETIGSDAGYRIKDLNRRALKLKIYGGGKIYSAVLGTAVIVSATAFSAILITGAPIYGFAVGAGGFYLSTTNYKKMAEKYETVNPRSNFDGAKLIQITSNGESANIVVSDINKQIGRLEKALGPVKDASGNAVTIVSDKSPNTNVTSTK
ncbi:MAG: hypothetical protein ACOYOK_02345 [Pseudobdellovibrionaceae bacterium]